ncbi:MAG: dTDP-4-amino-4,6-dideoxygalactose transaminase, partial [Prolixibacteraceae bacterium]|nr:dTDP-4-amino-4,6-dideoxygalactose transaminase [Prolixibacteraceae bacterium]
MNILSFNKPFHCETEFEYIRDAFRRNHVSGNGHYTKLCHRFFENRYGFKKCFLTTSGTDALEMCALLFDIQKGDEVIMPSFTFVSTALAFTRQGATIRFIDSRADFPGMDEDLIEEKITLKTKAIVVVHYAGIACNMDKVMKIAQKHNLYVVEDAAQCIDSFYTNRPLGGIGHLACFSFHETKNIHCGEGGMLVVNDDKFISRAEKIWEKGTNRVDFHRNEVSKYEWVETGSSFLPSDILAAMLFAQLEKMDEIQNKRKQIWERYNTFFSTSLIEEISYPNLPDYATNNGHLFWLVMKDNLQRDRLLAYYKSKGIHAVFHYQALHASAYYRSMVKEVPRLIHAENYSECLIRLPLNYYLTFDEVDYICEETLNFM